MNEAKGLDAVAKETCKGNGTRKLSFMLGYWREFDVIGVDFVARHYGESGMLAEDEKDESSVMDYINLEDKRIILLGWKIRSRRAEHLVLP